MFHRDGFGDLVDWKGRRVDVLSIIGASPDALLTRGQGESKKVYAVIEAKSRVPFLKIPSKSTGGPLSAHNTHRGILSSSQCMR